MTAMEIFSVICSCMAAVAALVAIITFGISRGKSKYDEGADSGTLKGDIKYIRNSFDDLRLEVKEINRNQTALNERVARVEESAKSAHKRIDTLEKELNHTEV